MEVSAVRRIAASPRALYDAWTNPAQVERWFAFIPGTTPRVTCEPTLGGAFQFDLVTPRGQVYVHRGEYLQLAPPVRIEKTWTSDSVDAGIMTIAFADAGDGVTDVELRLVIHQLRAVLARHMDHARLARFVEHTVRTLLDRCEAYLAGSL